jgi:hypothetical protein
MPSCKKWYYERVVKDALLQRQLDDKPLSRAALSNAALSISLTDRIMCRDQLLQLHKVGEKAVQQIENAEKRLKPQRGKLLSFNRPPVSGKCVSIAPAALVALLQMTKAAKQREADGDMCGGSQVIYHT